MRGLIIKDLIYVKNNYKTAILMLIGSLLISISLGNYLLTISVLPLMLLASCISTFQTDEFYNTEAFTLTFPISRKKIVLSKYLFTIIMTIISTYIGIVIYLLVFYLINPGYKGINTDMIKELFMLECAALIVDAIFYPIIYKYGCEKSRLVLMSIVMLLLGILSIASVYINVISKKVIDLDKILLFINNHGLPVLIILVIVFMILSYFLSLFFYKRKDY